MSAFDRLITGPLPKPLPQTNNVRPVLLGAFLIVARIGLLQVAQTSNATTTGYTLNRLEQQRQDVQAQVHQLEAEVASLTSMDRIQAEAQGRLGMVPAGTVINLEVHKPPPDQQLIPRRFAPEPKAPQPTSTSWWQSLVRLLPFH
jgi:cell division protein FtsL